MSGQSKRPKTADLDQNSAKFHTFLLVVDQSIALEHHHGVLLTISPSIISREEGLTKQHTTPIDHVYYNISVKFPIDKRKKIESIMSDSVHIS